MTEDKAVSDDATEPNEIVSESAAEGPGIAEATTAEATTAEATTAEPETDVVQESVDANSAEPGSADAAAKETPEPVELKPEDLEFSADEIVTDEDLEEEDEDEDASPIEEFVEPVKAVQEDLNMEWYILKVQVNRENSVCDALKRQVKMAGMESHFGDILVPTEDIREFNKAGKQRITKRKLYPGYIVVNMAIDDDSWFLVRDTSGIGDFAGAAGRPAPLSPDEIARIIATTRPEVVEGEDEDSIKTAIPFKVGDRVRVKEGYFQNYEGDISNVDERNGRIEVMINIFGRPNPVDMDHWHVEKV